MKKQVEAASASITGDTISIASCSIQKHLEQVIEKKKDMRTIACGESYVLSRPIGLQGQI